MQPALRRIAQLADLPPDWDSYGADRLSGEAIVHARELLQAVNAAFGGAYGQNVQPYAIAPLNDGGVQLEWRGPAAEIEVEISYDGRLGYLFIDKRGGDRSFHEQGDVARPDVLRLIGQTLSLHDIGS